MKRRAILLTGTAFLALPSALRAQSPTSITVAGVPEESITPALWAAQGSIFRRNGLEVDVQSQGSGSAVAAGVAGGSYAFGKAGVVSVIIAHSRGLPFVLVAPGGLYDSRFPYAKLVVKADSPMKTAADLNGKVFASGAVTDQTTIGAKAWIDQHGGDSSTLKIVELPFSVTAEAVASGRVDFGAIADPGLQAAIDAGKVRAFADFFDAIAPQWMNTAWFTTTSYLSTNRGIVEAFARSIGEATRFVDSHPGETVSVLAKFTGVDPVQISKTHRMKYAPRLDPRLIQPVVDVCAKYKVIPSAFDAKELIAPGFMTMNA